MAENLITPLHAQCIELYRSFLSASQTGAMGEIQLDWLAYAKTVTAAAAAGSLDPRTTSAIRVMAENIQSSATTLLALEKAAEESVKSLSEQLGQLVVTGPDCKCLINPGLADRHRCFGQTPFCPR
jgi:hypothetical protein